LTLPRHRVPLATGISVESCSVSHVFYGRSQMNPMLWQTD